MVDPFDIAYEDSVSSETFDVEAEWERQNGFEPELPEDFTGVDCWERYEDCRDYEALDLDDCAAEMLGE